MVKTAVRRPGNPTVRLIVAQTPLAGSKRPLILTAARIGRRPRLPYTRPTDASAAGRFRGVAQWLARLLWAQKVAGSSPVAPTSAAPSPRWFDLRAAGRRATSVQYRPRKGALWPTVASRST